MGRADPKNNSSIVQEDTLIKQYVWYEKGAFIFMGGYKELPAAASGKNHIS